jgi:hypothetical protein
MTANAFVQGVLGIRGPHLTASLASAFLFSGLACSEDGIEPLASTGTIEVTTVTEGDLLVPDSFEVQVDGARSGNMGPNDVYRMKFMPRGTYQIGLKDTSPDCRFSANPRGVLVTPKETAYTTFLVVCR